MNFISINKSISFVLTLSLILYGIIPKVAYSRKIDKKPINFVVVKCQNSNHSHPPLTPSDYNLESETLFFSYHDFRLINKNLFLLKRSKFLDHKIGTNPFITKKFHGRFQLARAPPLHEV
tara:strand:+ start:52 stop:411 length:360 start_codon:yes stop_codon:yes gene_type:complete